MDPLAPITPSRKSPFEVFAAFFILGLTSFGGPVAHIGYFRREFVEKRSWLGEAEFAQLLSLCQFLPGPASSQLGLVIGYLRGGWFGALSAFTAFTLPSVLLLITFASLLSSMDSPVENAALHGLKLVACVIVFDAVLGMWKTLCPDLPRRIICVIAAVSLLTMNEATAQFFAIGVGAIFGLLFCRADTSSITSLNVPYSPATGSVFIGLFAVMFVLFSLLQSTNTSLALAHAFFQPGAMVFGGGHVVLPLLEQSLVSTGWLNKDTFLAGYGASQAIPGPMFSFAAYLGAVIDAGQGPAVNAAIALMCLFLPGFLLVIGVLPLWKQLAESPLARAAIAGVNTVVVGILLAAFCDPVLTAGVQNWDDGAIVLAGIMAIRRKNVSPIWIVAGCVVFKIATTMLL